ncbi:hypothetical protein [Bacillus horti]|uniref:SLH domain-containing protein n=1 Tax=Caldalkalibacillus horti TaxID=77523 RepID=A0ABT9VV56_9BACI|nr:hypothetical protein [Bacillus horti]MDQ0164874.1 hypothetical protein [Bacillus horti]
MALYEAGILTGPSIQSNEPLTQTVAALIAVRAADFKELAYTYPVEKIDAALSKLQLSSTDFSIKTGQELATAVDTGLIPASHYLSFEPYAEASTEFVYELLGKVLANKGLYKNYIGYTSDADIFQQHQLTITN